MSISKKQYLVTASIVVGLLAIIGGVGYWFSRYELRFQNPVLVKVQKPVWVQQRVTTVNNVVMVVNADDNVSPLTPDEQFVCNLFKSDCKTAIAIMLTESGGSNIAYHVNDGGSVDMGCLQINSLWLKSMDVSKYNLFNCQQNAEVAYLIYSRDGNSFQDWVTYTTGSYKKNLIH